MNTLSVALFAVLVYLLVFYAVQTYRANWRKKNWEYNISEGFASGPPKKPKCKVAIVALMRKPIDLPIWLKHHRELGVKKFYIRFEDTPGWEEFLKAQKDIDYILTESDKSGNNYETLQTRQVAFTRDSMKKAKKAGIQWIIAIDADELLHGSLTCLDKLPKTKKCIKMENAEAQFSETDENCFATKKFLRCSRGAPCRSYANGKGGCRVEEGCDQAGPHDFQYQGQMGGDATAQLAFEDLCVLHFDSCTFGSWAEKFKHLGNKPTGSIPFPHYVESIKAANQAFDIYRKNTMMEVDQLDPNIVYKKVD